MGFDTETLNKILELQEVDRVLLSFRERLKKIPEEIEKKKKEISEIENRIKKEEEEIKIMEKEIKSLYLDLQEEEEKIKKFSADLMKVKTNEEYRACLKEIDHAKKRKDDIEEEILEREEKLEEKKKLFEEFKNKVRDEVNREKENLKKLEQEMKEIPMKIQEAEDLRKRRAMVIDKIALEEYERILDGRGWPVVCEILIQAEGGEKRFFCGGCNSQVPFLTVDEMIKTDKTARCHYCGRILYIKKENL